MSRRVLPAWGRSLLVAGLGAALLLGATAAGEGVDLAGGGSGDAAPAPTTELVSSAVLACPGPEQLGLEDPTVAEGQQAVRARAVTAPVEALPGGLEPEGGSVVLEQVPGSAVQRTPDRTEVLGQLVDEPAGAVARAEGGLAVGLAAAQHHEDLGDQQRGLTVAACEAPSTESWLVAGGAEPGRVERLVLVNPGGNPVTAQVEVLGESGPVQVSGGQGLVLAPGQRSVLLLDALAPQEAAPAVRVTSAGGPVAASLGDRWLDGTLDRGLSLTGATAPPATELVVPAVVVPEDPGAGTVTARIAVPGDSDAVVQLRALTAAGPHRVAEDVTLVEAGHTVDLDLGDLPPGAHGLQVTADVPVVAAVLLERRAEGDGAGDLAWLPAVHAIGASGLGGAPLMSVADREVSTTLALSSVDGARVRLVTVAANGLVRQSTVQVPAAGTTATELPPRASVWVRPLEGAVHAGLISTDEDGRGTLVDGMPLAPLSLTRDLLVVMPWRP